MSYTSFVIGRNTTVLLISICMEIHIQVIIIESFSSKHQRLDLLALFQFQEVGWVFLFPWKWYRLIVTKLNVSLHSRSVSHLNWGIFVISLWCNLRHILKILEQLRLKKKIRRSLKAACSELVARLCGWYDWLVSSGATASGAAEQQGQFTQDLGNLDKDAAASCATKEAERVAVVGLGRKWSWYHVEKLVVVYFIKY